MAYVTTELTNFNLHFGWMMERRAELNADYNDGLIEDEMDLVDPDDALAYATERFEDVEEVLCEQAYLEDQVEEGWWDPDYCLGEED